MVDKLVLVDTSAWIHGLRKGGSGPIRKSLAQCLDESRVAIFGMIAVELLQGERTIEGFHQLQGHLSSLHWIEWKEAYWTKAATYGFQLARVGTRVPSADLLIATVAMENNCSLLHADRHFDHIKRHLSLTCVQV